MKVRQNILDQIDNPQMRTLIAVELGVGEAVIAVHMRRNSEDGRMTKMDFLKAISKVLKVSIEDILEKEAIDLGE